MTWAIFEGEQVAVEMEIGDLPTSALIDPVAPYGSLFQRIEQDSRVALAKDDRSGPDAARPTDHRDRSIQRRRTYY